MVQGVAGTSPKAGEPGLLLYKGQGKKGETATEVRGRMNLTCLSLFKPGHQPTG